jgi:hypothetical protein
MFSTLFLACLLGSDPSPDADGDGVDAANDCNDANPYESPEMDELCDGADNDCDGVVDEGVLEVWFTDSDGDGYGDAAAGTPTCFPPSSSVQDDTDCDDEDPLTHPGATETCDARDEDCDTHVDEGATTAWYQDADGDGHGDPEVEAILGCEQPEGTVASDADCDDRTALIGDECLEISDLQDGSVSLETEVAVVGVVTATAHYGFFLQSEQSGAYSGIFCLRDNSDWSPPDRDTELAIVGTLTEYQGVTELSFSDESAFEVLGLVRCTRSRRQS